MSLIREAHAVLFISVLDISSRLKISRILEFMLISYFTPVYVRVVEVTNSLLSYFRFTSRLILLNADS